MIHLVTITCIGLAVLWVTLRNVSLRSVKVMRLVVLGFAMANGVALLGAAAFVFTDVAAVAQQGQPAEQGVRQEERAPAQGGNKALAAALAVGLACIGAGVAVAVAGSAAIGGITQNPDIFGRSLVLVGLAEGIAIYGLIIAFMILTG